MNNQGTLWEEQKSYDVAIDPLAVSENTRLSIREVFSAHGTYFDLIQGKEITDHISMHAHKDGISFKHRTSAHSFLPLTFDYDQYLTKTMSEALSFFEEELIARKAPALGRGYFSDFHIHVLDKDLMHLFASTGEFLSISSAEDEKGDLRIEHPRVVQDRDLDTISYAKLMLPLLAQAKNEFKT